MSTAEVLSHKVKHENPRTGISAEDTRKLAEGLSRALSETYVLYLKTQGFHWNVVGPLFYGLHKLTEEQYQDLAERIRALGHPAPATFARFLELSDEKEAKEGLNAKDMVNLLVKDHETVSRTFRKTIAAADDADDVVTADLLTRRLDAHEKAAWMLRSIIAE